MSDTTPKQRATIAKRTAEDLLDTVKHDPEFGAHHIYAEQPVRGHRYMIEGNGPTAYFIAIYDSDRQVDYGLLEYIDAYGSAVHHINERNATIIEKAMRKALEERS